MTTTTQESASPSRAVQAPAAVPGSVPVSGLVDIDPKTDGHGLIRVNGYRPSPADVYVSAGQIKQYGLRKGDRIDGTARPSVANNSRSTRSTLGPRSTGGTVTASDASANPYTGNNASLRKPYFENR